MSRDYAILAGVMFLAAIPAFGLESHRRAAAGQLQVPRMQVVHVTPPPRPTAALLPWMRPASRDVDRRESNSRIRRCFSHVSWYQANTPADREFVLFPASTAPAGPATIPAQR